MKIHCQVGTYRHAKLQRNWLSNYRVIVIVIKLTPLRFARGTCISGHPHTPTIVQYLVEGIELPRKKEKKRQQVKRLLRNKPLKSVTGRAGPGCSC